MSSLAIRADLLSEARVNDFTCQRRLRQIRSSSSQARVPASVKYAPREAANAIRICAACEYVVLTPNQKHGRDGAQPRSRCSGAPNRCAGLRRCPGPHPANGWRNRPCSLAKTRRKKNEILQSQLPPQRPAVLFQKSQLCSAHCWKAQNLHSAGI